MGYEVTRDFALEEVEIETPIGATVEKVIAGKKVAIVPILRAGLGMVDGMLKLIPAAKVGHIGLYRDPDTLEPVEYYCKLPMDVRTQPYCSRPYVSYGGSASAAITFLKKEVKSIKLVCLVAAPEGIERMQRSSDVDIFVAAVDERLNEFGYIVPGLGDAGDRLLEPNDY